MAQCIKTWKMINHFAHSAGKAEMEYLHVVAYRPPEPLGDHRGIRRLVPSGTGHKTWSYSSEMQVRIIKIQREKHRF